MTNQKTVGLVVAPGVTERLAENLIQEMPKMLSTHYDHQQEWIFDLVTDPLTGFAESVDEIFEKVADYHDKRQWDYVIAITDLPMFADKQVMALDINMENGAAIFSYPAFGWRPVKKRFKHVIYNIIQELNEAEQESRNYDNNNQIENSVKKQFPLSKIDKETIYMKETDSYHLRYLSSSRSRGMFRLVSGMTFANNPLNMMASLSNIVAIAFTTGAFGLVFTTMWQMAYNFSMWRLFGISIIAIIGMLIWIMMSHDLWEPVNKSNHKRITWLYNLTTIMTLIFAIIIYYIILYLLFIIAEIVLLPSGFLGQQVGLKGPAGIDLYLSIPWFAASISTVAGAIGAGLLNDELIKESTYGYRQRVRYEEQRR
ncbi:5,10-methylene-tetrahydrofolate dehydrogenase [Staphylococcus epidermidis]|uniref:5,10-methylene-tetrahydrofolate dehydrogenase n=1 Tax=Staphylococcus epidermidis TaxID=1282 RepID=UPI001D1505F7|nr:5,10-methylene-tetrahydrofolate dehydrogenase [Staphylococcus epidermidis]MCC3672196.1 5,10-methylene-tetrahydrofolate dehydrogenase [Staphylococcus epidermidis]MCC3699126.1 5,10-methylene-tetrahydrofolate dehydrogenase [Staphylococcus epidermidis]MCG1077375.1 5,10-methylene-tetrahydrofolate dehydrogenase [Staphylococcus epidermidis]MCG1149772.1 5,10-methylene-tetrahydrofolate dehydrogenase [Staphylococcus epidermidis]MCG1151301.1 5,10-methylene-tetrahydrofolate dehydrogenase [Staphylococcu